MHFFSKYSFFRLYPIWTVKTGAFFIIDAPPEEFFGCTDGIKFEIFDFDSIGGHDKIGYVYLSPQRLFEGTGERFEYEVVLDTKLFKKTPCYLAIRSSPATSNDISFLRKVNNGSISSVTMAKKVSATVPNKGKTFIKGKTSFI